VKNLAIEYKTTPILRFAQDDSYVTDQEFVIDMTCHSERSAAQ
jgi:hypothetical protein